MDQHKNVPGSQVNLPGWGASPVGQGLARQAEVQSKRQVLWGEHGVQVPKSPSQEDSWGLTASRYISSSSECACGSGSVRGSTHLSEKG